MRSFSNGLAMLTVLAGTTLCAALASAQGLGLVPPKEPANNRALALAQGKQFVGLGNKCLQIDLQSYGLLTLHDCDPNNPAQRFKFEDNKLKTAAKVVVWDDGGMGSRAPGTMRWENVCVAAHAEWRLQGDKCSDYAGRDQGPISWRLNGREIRSGNSCFDVRKDQTANGTPIIHWGCQGKSNQQWTMR